MKLIKLKKNTDPLLHPESERLTNGMMIILLLGGITVAYFAKLSSANFLECGWCMHLNSYIPAIESFSIGSKAPDPMKYAIVYYVLITPFFFAFLLIKPVRITRKIQNYNKYYIFLGTILLFSLYGYYSGYEFGGPDSISYHKAYYLYLPVSAAVSGLSYALSFFLSNVLISIAKCEINDKRKTA